MIVATILNANGSKKSGDELWTPDDFMPGAKTDLDDLEEFAREVESGTLTLPDAEQVKAFQKRILSQIPSAMVVTNG